MKFRLIKMVFDDILPDSLCRSYGELRHDETLTRLRQSTHVYMCHAISFMSYDVSDSERFPISQEVMLFFFIPGTNSRFLTSLAYTMLLH